MVNNSIVLSEIIQPLSSKDKILGFDCGDDDLNDFLRLVLSIINPRNIAIKNIRA